MSDNITLCCLVEGDSKEEAFEVKLEKNNSVNDLKKKIKEEQPNSFVNIDAKNIVLWEVNVSTVDETTEVNIVLNDIQEKLKLSSPTKKIGNIFTESIPDDSIHIIVKLPCKYQANYTFHFSQYLITC